MNILCITHRDNSLGILEEWGAERGHNLEIWGPYKNDKRPDTDGLGLLIVMGGPQRIVALDKDPYLKDEIALIKSIIESGKPVLGICLGAQLIGEALGGKGELSPEKEIGIFPVTLTEDGQSDPLLEDFPEFFPVFHLHNDMPGLTDDAVLLAHSKGCPRQIVRYTPKVYGFQCHLEFGDVAVKRMLEAISSETGPSEFIQRPEVLLAQDRKSINHKMIQVLDRMVALG